MIIEETKDYIGMWVAADYQEDTVFTADGDFIYRRFASCRIDVVQGSKERLSRL